VRRVRAGYAVVAAALALWIVAAPRSAAQGVQEAGQPAAGGAALYADGCASCHGADLRGVRGRGPTLRGVGAAAVDFYLSTGRMPLARPGIQPDRAEPVYDRRERAALVAFITARGGAGPPIPVVRPERGDLARGRRLFADACSGCHQIMGKGGIGTGFVAPGLGEATPTQLAEAVRVGPYLMPRFSREQLPDADVDAMCR